MNPPATKGPDFKHVCHADDFLAPGGILVAITSPWQPATLAELRKRVKTVTAEPIPAGTFKESGTFIATQFLILKK